jgi:hypothetical protein
MQKKLDHAKFCNTYILRKFVVNMGIRLYNNMPDHIKNGTRLELLNENRDLLQHAFCSVGACGLEQVSLIGRYTYLFLISIDIITLYLCFIVL